MKISSIEGQPSKWNMKYIFTHNRPFQKITISKEKNVIGSLFESGKHDSPGSIALKSSGGFRGGASGPPSFMMKTQLGAPFWREMRPSSWPYCTLFLTVLVRIWGETYKSRHYLEERPKNLLNMESKNLCAHPACFRYIVFLAPSLQVGPLQLWSGFAPVKVWQHFFNNQLISNCFIV